jgi:hypothetical protein
MNATVRVILCVGLTTIVVTNGSVRSVATSQGITVRLPLSESSGMCSFGGRNVISLRSEGDSSVEVRCAVSQDRIQCEGTGVEPLDLAVSDRCGARSVRLIPGTERRVALEDKAAVDVEWLDFSAAGSLSVIARRTFQGPVVLSLIVAQMPTRLLRFIRDAASPVSVSLSEVTGTAGWALPAAKHGGELLLIPDRGTVMPAAFNITGVSVPPLTAPVGKGIIPIHGLPEGSYEIRGVYESGLTLKSSSAFVTSSQSTIVKLPKAPVGGAAVRGSITACRLASEFVLQSTAARDQGRDAAQVVWSSAPGTCSWNVSGLAPGVHEASLRGPSGIVAFRRFDVSSQMVADVELVDATVIVDGKVSYNGSGLPDAQVSFIPMDRMGDGATAQTDRYGLYSVNLPRGGAYTVLVSGAGVRERRTTKFVDGNNRLDVALQGATTLRVHISGIPDGSSTQVHLRGLDQSALWSIQGPGPGEDVTEWRGIPFGRYSVSARSGSLVSKVESVELSESRPTAAIELALAPSLARLLLVDERGTPIDGSIVVVNGRRLEAVARGVYSLSDLPPGAPAIVRADGFSATCRRLSPSEDVRIVLTRGISIKMRFDSLPTKGLLEAATLAGMTNSDCPVPLTAFNPQRVDGTQFVFAIANFPEAGSLLLTTPSGSQTIAFSEPGVILVR